MKKQGTLGAAFVAAAGLLMWSGAYAQDTYSGSASNQSGKKESRSNARSANPDQHFVEEAAEGSLAEIELGKIAEQRATDPAVKQFAQTMIQGHTQANEQLKSAATKDNLTLPTQLDKKQQQHIDRMSKLSGAEFDKAYMRWTVRQHRRDIAMFKREADKGQNSGLKSYAQSMIPDLQHHLQMAEQTGAQIGAIRSGEAASSNASQSSGRYHQKDQINQNSQSNPNNQGNPGTRNNPNRPNPY